MKDPDLVLTTPGQILACLQAADRRPEAKLAPGVGLQYYQSLGDLGIDTHKASI